MQNKYIKYLQLSFESIHLSYLDANEQNVRIRRKWLSYLLMITATVLWVIFNIVVIESSQFPPYLLVVLNLVLYCIIASMVNPAVYAETKQ